MNEVSFRYMPKQNVYQYARQLFDILFTNMTVIAPTGNTYEEDYLQWSTCWRQELDKHEIVLIEMDNRIVGFFSYSCRDRIFYMNEIQFYPAYKAKYGLFRKLYAFVAEYLPDDLLYVDAHTNMHNEKAIAILGRLGLKIVGTRHERSYNFRGEYQDFLAWLNK